MSNHALYDQDFYAWTNQQASLLRTGRLAEADVEHIAAEIEAMDVAYRRALLDAVGETGLARSTFPPSCPWTWDEIMHPDFPLSCHGHPV